jgi:hypothetical protein
MLQERTPQDDRGERVVKIRMPVAFHGRASPLQNRHPMQRRSRRIALATAGLLAASILFVGLAWRVGWLRPPSPRATDQISHSAYVWQRAWSDPVRRAFEGRARALGAGTVVLAAEIGWRDGAPEHVEVALDHALIAAAGGPVGLALRIGPCPPTQLREPATLAYIAGVAQRAVAAARAGGWEPSELQLDFDCATSRLDEYRAWVESIGAGLRPMPVTITVLPSWMSSDSFGPLIRASAGFVLQVHSVEKASLEGGAPSLCDAASAIRWTERAAYFNVPFRVALPTYGYIAMFDDQGALAGLLAEGRPSALADGLRVREVSADPAAMAALVAHWTRSRPAAMQGIVWYRLPVEGDRLNWAWPTFARVLRGEAPAGSLAVSAREATDGPGSGTLLEVIAENGGDLDVELPRDLAVRWADGVRLLGADALAGMEWRRDAECSVRFARFVGLGDARLRPGERRMLGWILLSGDMEVTVDVVE